MAGRIIDQPDVNLIFGDPAYDVVGAADPQRHRQSRVLLPEAAQRTGHQIADEAFADRNVDVAAPQALDIAQLRQRVVAIGGTPMEMLHQKRAGFGRPHAAAMALQQHDIEALFQQRDLPAHHRRIDAERIRRRPHRAVVDRREQIVQPVIVHAVGHD